MSAIFTRKWLLEVGESQALSTADLRVVFKVKKTLEKEPNTADIKVSNLSEAGRSKLTKKGTPVVLSAGYDGNVSIIFSGDARTIDHVREKADWVTHIQCGDGEHVYNYARVNESFAAGTSTADALRRVAAKLGLNTGNLEDALKQSLAVTTFKHGFAAFGPASQVFDRLVRAVGLAWSIQQGALQLHRKDEPVQPQAFRLTPDSGLLGSPDHSAPDKKNKKPPILKCRSLLNPRLVPGHVVTLDTRGVKGEFVMRTVEHSGDSHGTDWFTDIECVARKT